MKAKIFLAVLAKRRLVTGAVSLIFFLGSISAAFALGSPWVTVGSAGTADEANVDYVSFSGGIASIDSSAPEAVSAVLRYNIVSAPDLEDAGANVAMKVRFRDNGANARVVVSLKRYSMDNGGSYTMLTFDSNDMPSSTVYQTATVQDGCSGPHFDFQNYSYYLEVTLSRTSSAGTPAFSIAQLFDIDIC